MNPKFLRELRQFKKASQLRSWVTYREIIGRLCQAHTQYDFVHPISGFVRNQDVRRLVEYADSLSEQKYSDATQHFVANQFASLIRKYPFPSELSPYKAKEKAKEKWLLAEERCSQTNARFLGPTPSLEPELSKMRAFIRFVLSDSPKLEDIFRRCDFGPGASIGVHGNATNKARKIASRWSVTPRALNYAYLALTFNWHLFSILLEEGPNGIKCLDSDKAFTAYLNEVTCIQYNKIAFVPKTVKVDRPIAVEPLLNGFVQKGIDLYMRAMLARVGLNLEDQTVNQEFARQGSLSDDEESFVTIDLSSASDSISIEVVRNLLPYDWFRLLDGTRSTHYRDEKGVISPYHKFCSMGNGFCFPLETLLFASVCSAAGCGRPGIDFVVYGDDIIVRKSKSHDVVRLLGELGFETNANKTFLEGPFRESCGSDWFGGEDVRPFTLDFRLDSLESYFKFLNLSERNERTTSFFACIRDFIISNIPVNLRFCRLRDGNADSGYRVGQDEFLSSPYSKWDPHLQCWSWLELISTPVSDDWRQLRYANYSHMFAALSGSSSTQPFTARRQTRTNVRRVAYG